jgi:hypothetical protein
VMGAGQPAVPGDVEEGWQAPTAMSGPEVGPGDGAAEVVQCGGALGGGQGGGAGVGVLEVDVVGEVAGDGNGRGVGVVPVGGLVQAAGVGRVGQDEAYAGAPAWVHGCVRLCVLWVSAAPVGGLLRGHVRQGLPGGVERQVGGVDGSAGLLPPGLGERAGLEPVEAQLVREFQHDGLGSRVVAGDRDDGTSGGPGGPAEAGQASRADGVERLNHRVAELCLHPLAFGQAGVDEDRVPRAGR